jgi:hypothetical protein
MNIELSPQVRLDTLSVTVNGEVITVNEAVLDLSGIPDGYRLPAEAFESAFVLGAYREGGVLSVELIMPCAPDEARRSVLFPETIVANDGPVALPTSGEG